MSDDLDEPKPPEIGYWTFTVAGYDPETFDFARHAVVAATYLRGQHGRRVLGTATFIDAVAVPGSYKPSTGGMWKVRYGAPCVPLRLPTLAEANDPDVDWSNP